MFKTLCVIPLYNHKKTIREVACGVLNFCRDVLVIDDGSSDDGIAEVKELPVQTIVFPKNRGKGAAIIAAADFAKKNNFTHILTIDADAQHYPKDIPLFLEAAQENPFSIIIGKRDFSSGNVPFSSKFGREVSNFWARVQTGKKIKDMQSGFRIYPLEIFGKFKIFAKRFDFEIEIVIKSLWAGFSIKEIEIKTFYPKEGRISHFNFLKDNARIAVLNTYLTMFSMIPLPRRKYFYSNGEFKSLSPFQVIVERIKSGKNPLHLAVSAAWGSFCGALALPGIRTMILFVGVGWFNLNRAVSFTVDKLAAPPFIPFVCIEIGYFLRHGEFLTQISWQIIGRQFLQRVYEWFIGSLIVAPVFAFLVGFCFFIIGLILRRGFIYGEKLDGEKQK
ncbi:MAG: glycosyltransferase [Elusimicrobiota bacterium]|jgi:glycosyltransferase involved in cell wall biosynthesis|nr:glycosyltransferase [Elusimicrobiota bacterium]